MEQTPLHDQHNPELLELVPLSVRSVIEVGCSSGALAREYKRRNPSVNYTGIEIEPSYAAHARKYCDRVLDIDIESAPNSVLEKDLNAECWIFGDVLEHLYDPWRLLSRIREHSVPGAYIVACIPNAQHWSVQARLSFGDFRYEDSGLLDRTHIRWFTRATIYEMFQGAGFEVEIMQARVFPEPMRENFLPAIRLLAAAANADAEQSVRDAIPLQYVLRAVSH